MNDTEHARNPSQAAPASSVESHDGNQDEIRRQDRGAPSREKEGVDIDRRDDTTDRAGGAANQPREIGGRKGPDPVRYGDWEKNGRCIDF